MQKIIIYCDGACSGNQFTYNKGGWGAVLKYGDKIEEIYGGERNTTNQRMELTACIKALEHIKSNNIPVEVYSDSAYLVNCMRQRWYKKWQKNGWVTSSNKKVENKDLWLQLLELLNKHIVHFYKVTGHSNIKLNELADSLANKGINKISGSAG